MLIGRPLDLVLAAFFVANAILAEFIGVKIFALEDTLGLDPFARGAYSYAGVGGASAAFSTRPSACGIDRPSK